MHERRTDRGSALVLTVMIGMGLTGATTLALMPVLGDLLERQRARTAADAAALAGVTDGRSGAADLARVNGGVLVGWSESGDEVRVVVRVGDRTATARATDAP